MEYCEEKSELLRRHQLTLLSMLKEVDRICTKYEIRYMLFAGTALGAVRHHGFIPWDDDLDILMLRSEYEKFLAVAELELDSQIFYLQKEGSEHWPLTFSKLRLNQTAFMEKFVPKDRKMHQGVYLDIFPCDELSDCHIWRGVQFVASRIVVANRLFQRGYLTDSWLKKIVMEWSRFFPQKFLHRLACGEQKGKSQMLHAFFAASSCYRKSIFPRKWICELQKISFEGQMFPISSYYEELLTVLYGDYKKIPEESERACKQHAMKIDLEHSYEIYLDWQEKQKIDLYARSIR